MSALNGFLGKLNREVVARRPAKSKVTRRHFDEGHPIGLSYDASFYTTSSETLSVVLPSASVTPDDPWAGSFGGNYRIEAFDAGTEAVVPVWGTGELEALDGGTVSMSLSDADEVPIWGTGELESLDSAASEAQSFRSRMFSDDSESPVWGTGELESLGDATETSQSMSDDASAPEMPAWGTGQLDDSDDSNNSEDEDDESNRQSLVSSSSLNIPADDAESLAFAQDLQAILAGKKSHPSTQPQLPAASFGEDDDITSHAPAYASGSGHALFDRMGKNMSMATTFDLGSYSLDRQFDVFDQRLDAQEPKPKESSPSRSRSIVSERDFSEDLAFITAPVTQSVRSVAMEQNQSYSLAFDVPLVPQQTGMSCWAAGCAMLVGWRDQMSVDPAEIANATGHWRQYQQGLQAEDVSIFPIWGMSPEVAQTYNVQAFFELLDRYGPLWVASAEPGAHVRVVTGIQGDGTADGTTLLINDPWEDGMQTFRANNRGSRTSETYTQFVAKQATLGRRELNVQGVYVAHLRDPRSR